MEPELAEEPAGAADAVAVDASAHSGHPGAVTRSRMGWLLGVRLGVSIAVFALALALVGAGREGALAAERGLYGTLAFAFFATAAHASVFAWVRRPQALRRLAAVQLATDLVIVTSLVAFSGGSASIFSFLFLPVSVTGAMLFGRRGAYGAAAAASLAYALAVLLEPGVTGSGATPAPEEAVAVWGVHTGALLLVALLASALVAELRLAGERLHESKDEVARLRSLHERTVESLTSGLLTTDGAGRVTSFNPEAEAITGWSGAEVRGQYVDDVLPGASAFLAAGSSLEGRPRSRMFFEHQDGHRKHLGIAASPLRDSAGHVVIFQDVTEVVRMEQELRRSERLAGVGELAAAIAHEIRNPLAAISGSVEILRSGRDASKGGEESDRLMGIVLREIERLDALITDFLAYARPASPKAESLLLGGLLSEMADMIDAGLGEGATLEIAVDPSVRVFADGAQLRQVFWNLLRNASDAIGGVGRITIQAQADGSQDVSTDDRNTRGEDPEMVEIHVSDTGPGIAPEVLERMFDPFFTTKKDGTGLGLPTVHRIVEAQGGTLAVESEVGKGTTFRIILPAAEASW